MDTGDYMAAGLQVFSKSGLLLYDSNVTKIFYVHKVIRMQKEEWVREAAVKVTYSDPSLNPTKHVALRMLGASRTVVPRVEQGQLVIDSVNTVGTITGAPAGTWFQVIIMRYN